jgi:hypothetical protein
LPEAPFLHLFVPRGAITVEAADAVHTGDAVRFAATGGQQVTATEPAEILVWESTQQGASPQPRTSGHLRTACRRTEQQGSHLAGTATCYRAQHAVGRREVIGILRSVRDIDRSP